MRELGIAEEIEITRPAPGYAGIIVQDRDTGRRHNLADVGFGISQVLPIFARLATAAPDSLVLVEQPELHLHPETQGALVDAMMDLARRRKLALLVESHSENILLRLRRRVAERVIDPDDVRLYVTDRGAVKQAAVQPNGNVDMSAFPKDFFEEEWVEAVELARVAAMHREQ
jgi:predicted ATPase